MKWIKNLLIIACLSVAFSPIAFAETNSCEVAKEARQPEAEVDISNVNTFVVCNVDNTSRMIHGLSPKSFESAIVQDVSDYLELDTSLYYADETDILQLIVSSFIYFIMGAIAFLFLLGMTKRLYDIVSANKNPDLQKEELNKTVKFVALYLVLGLIVFYDTLLLPILISGALILTATLNFASSEFILFASRNFQTDEVNVKDSEFLTSFDRKEESLINLATVELRTKYATLSVNGYSMTKNDLGGFFDSNSTQNEILNNIENNKYVVVVPKVNNGVVNTVDFVWNTDYEDYDEDKYGEGNKIGSMSTVEDTANYEESIGDTGKMSELKARGQNDALALISANTMLSVLKVFKEESLVKLKEGNTKDLERKANLSVVNFIKNDFLSKVNAIRSELKMERISGKELSLYVAAYLDGYKSSLLGYNTAGTYVSKFMLSREAALSIREWNCSNEFKENKETRMLADEVNGSGNMKWTDTYKKVLTMNTDCIVSENGIIRVNGVDKKQNAAAQEEFKFQSMAVAYAINRYNSHVEEGIHRAYKEQQKTKNEYANAMLKHIDKGFVAVAKIVDSISEIKSHDNLINSLIFSNSSSSFYGSVSNSLQLDYQNLFGDTNITDVEGLEQFKSINTHYDPVIIESLISGKNAKSTSAELRVIEDSGTMDKMAASIQSQFTTFNDFKKGIGLDPNKSFESGMAECDISPESCVGRRTGTISDFMHLSSQSLEIGLKFAAFLALVDALDAVKDLGSVVEFFGFDGKTGMGGIASKLIGMAGKLAGMVIDLIQVISAVLWNLVYILIILGFYVGYWLPAMLLVSFLLLQFYIAASILSFIVFIFAFALKAAMTHEWRHFLFAFQIIGATYAAILFRFIGLLFAVILVSWLPVGYVIYNVFDFAYTGNLLTLVVAYILSLFTAGFLYKAATENLVEFITDKSSMLFSVGKSLFSASSNDLANVAQTLIVDRAVNGSIKSAADSVSKRLRDKVGDIEKKNSIGDEPLKESTSTKGI